MKIVIRRRNDRRCLADGSRNSKTDEFHLISLPLICDRSLIHHGTHRPRWVRIRPRQMWLPPWLPCKVNCLSVHCCCPINWELAIWPGFHLKIWMHSNKRSSKCNRPRCSINCKTTWNWCTAVPPVWVNRRVPEMPVRRRLRHNSFRWVWFAPTDFGIVPRLSLCSLSTGCSSSSTTASTPKTTATE